MFSLRNTITTKITRESLESFIRMHTSNGLTLDVGCGNSPYAQYFANRVSLDYAKREGLDVIGDAHQLPFKSATFSIVVATELLEHVKHPQYVINEMWRVLKRGGKVVLSTRFAFPLHDVPNDFYRFTKYGLRYLFRKWSCVEIIPESDSLTTIAILLQRLAFQCDFYGSRITKLLLLVLATVFKRTGRVMKAQYGDIGRREREDQILVSGYYVVATK